jgi:hypothetical protein
MLDDFGWGVLGEEIGLGAFEGEIEEAVDDISERCFEFALTSRE